MPDPLDRSGEKMHDFLGQIIDRAPEVDSVAEAEQLTRGVLATLAQAVSSGQFADLTAGLPPELRDDGDLQSGGQAEALDFGAFIDRVGGHSSSVDAGVVERQARAVLTTLSRWAPPRETANTTDQLPKGLRELFTPASEE